MVNNTPQEALSQKALEEILKCKVKLSRESDIKHIYNQILIYVAILSDMGSATDISVLAETRKALESVFPESEINTFLVKPPKQKQDDLKEYVDLVCGIRLFANLSSRLDGVGIKNFNPEQATEIIKEIQDKTANNAHVPSFQIYPLFKKLAVLYRQNASATTAETVQQLEEKAEQLPHNEVSIQTDTHPPFEKTSKYIFSEWEYRKEALDRLKREQSKTIETQTLPSTFQRSVEVQCWVFGKEASSQTVTSSGTNTSKTVSKLARFKDPLSNTVKFVEHRLNL